MTQADNATALRKSLDSVTGRAQKPENIAATSPLPDGWGSFFSEPDPRTPNSKGRWYATAPYYVPEIKDRLGKHANGLYQTVEASTWSGLYTAVALQVEMHNRLMSY